MKFGLSIPLWVVTVTTVAAHDLTKLPLGDNLKSESPKQGHLWPCRIEDDAGGAFRDGPWIKGSVFDKTAKPVVPGDVKWPSTFAMTRDGDQRRVTGNGLPQHGTGVFPIGEDTAAYQFDHNPNSIAAQAIEFTLPAVPELASSPSCAPGAVGVLLSGTALYSAIDAPGRDAVAHEIQDRCDGHPQPVGIYHYHSLSPCAVTQQAMGEHPPLVGYAIDGFGIYGGTSGRISNADLDSCHGHRHEINWDGVSRDMYHYHATDEFPYTVGCLMGTANMDAMFTLAGPPT